MKDRQKKMLRLLLSQKDLFHLDDLAKTFSIGKRTVSRDLDSIERWLALKGARLDRKPGQGISVQTYGGTAEELLEVINTPVGYIESLDPTVRKNLILLYLLYNNREIKISEMAAAFLISDTSVWNDLNLIEKRLSRPTLALQRHKGVGIQLSGEESQIRLEFLQVLTELISARTIIPYLYSLKTDNVNSLEMNQLHYFMEKLNFPANRGTVLKALSALAKKRGYQYTMSGEAVLYFYLQLSVHRIKSGCLIEKEFPAHPAFMSLAENLLSGLVERIFSGILPKGEISFLALFMGVLETGSPPELTPVQMELVKEKPIQDFTADFIDCLSQLDNHMYYLNDKVESILYLTVSSLVTRLKYGIPLWHGEWGDTPGESEKKEEKRAVLCQLIEKHFGIIPGRKDLDYLILYFQSLFFQEKELPSHKIRCLVCCFEGIGLASYLQSILQKELDVLDVVESTAVFKIRQDYLEANRIELVISTFPLSGITTPVVNIALPLNKARLIEEITGLLDSLDLSNRPADIPRTPILNRREVPFDKIIQFIGGFSHLTMEYSDKMDLIIEDLAESLTDSEEKARCLARDFREREKLGTLSFEEYDTRVLHCKSSAVREPVAGVLEFTESSRKRMLFLAAPDPCPDGERKLLSLVTLSFLDNNRFREALTKGSLSEMRRVLMDVYKEII
ncbi:MAG: HTH domain-containing protein [Spirochaetales bacterium]|nr:HTH domain-containing protein [Spirochaetales bacterium]